METEMGLEELLGELRICDEDIREARCSRLLSRGERESFLTSLESQLEQVDGDEKNLQVVAEIVAELGKVETSRIIFAERKQVLVKKLVEGIEQASLPTAELCCRAVGNMCHDCDVGREAVLSQNGVTCIAGLLAKLLKESKDEVESPQVSSCRRVVVGCLLNLVCDCEQAQVEVVEKKVVAVIKDTIIATKTKEDIVVLLLSVISCLSETDVGRNELYEQGVVPLCVEILEMSRSCNLVGAVIDLIATLVDHEEEKLRIANSGVCERLLETMDVLKDALTSQPSSTPIGVTDEDLATWSQSALEQAERAVCDVVALVLSGEGASEALFHSGTGFVYETAQKWLDSEEDSYVISGCLAIGNFARNDESAGVICNDGVGEKLLSIVLARNDENDSDREVLACSLSALKNLCVSPANRPVLLQQGLLDTASPLLMSSPSSSRHLKSDFLYATLIARTLSCCRLAIQVDDDAGSSTENTGGGEPSNVAASAVWPVFQKKEVVDSVVGLCSFDGHMAAINTIRTEARRLLAAVAKNALKNQGSDPEGAKRVLLTLLNSNAVPQLMQLLTSVLAPTTPGEAKARDILSNESLVALITVTLLLGNEHAARVSQALFGTDSSFLEALEQMLGHSEVGDSSTAWQPAVVVNGVVLLEALIDTGSTSGAMASRLKTALEKARDHSSELVRERAKKASCSTST